MEEALGTTGATCDVMDDESGPATSSHHLIEGRDSILRQGVPTHAFWPDRRVTAAFIRLRRADHERRLREACREEPAMSACG